MTTLIHILGADIPHHNQTLLRFFNDQLATGNPHARRFMLVSPQQGLMQQFPALSICCYPDQKQLALALLACAKANRNQRFLLHGQFNPHIWLALLTGSLPASQVSWHIWGADLYETARGLTHRLFYCLRRLAQRRISCVFATRGDLHYFAQRHPRRPAELLYFPARMPELPPVAADDKLHQPLTILVGNSGDVSNRHILALQAIYRQFGSRVTLILPMGYPAGNEKYIRQVEQVAGRLFAAENLHILRETLAFDHYLSLLSQCQLGYFLFARQQGIGTLCLLIQANIPCVLHRDNPFWRDMQEQQLPVLFSDQKLDDRLIHQAHQQLQQKNKTHIAFFSPGYLPLWQRALAIAAEGRHDIATI